MKYPNLISGTLLCAVTFLNFFWSQAQEREFQFDTRFVYEMVFLTDSLDPKSENTELTELLTGDTVSLFRTLRKVRSDSMFLNRDFTRMPEPVVTRLGAISPLHYQVFKFSGGDILTYDEYTGSNLNNLSELNYYKDFIAPEDWTIHSDTTTILGFSCQKASLDFGGRTWTAWFAAEMPIADGPYKFCGLPGLIVRIADASNSWAFALKAIEQIDTSMVFPQKKGLVIKETTKQKLFEQRRNHQKNIMEMNEANGFQYGDNRKELKATLDEYITKDNNWIEK